MRDSPAATSSTARWRSSMRACSDTANSTRSSLSRPISTFCAWRTRRIWTKYAIARRRARKPAAAAPIATQPTAVVSESGIQPLPQREDDLVFGGVVGRVALAGIDEVAHLLAPDRGALLDHD